MEYNVVKSFVSNITNCGEFGSKIITRTIPSWRATTNNPYIIIRKEGRKVVERIERVTKMTFYNNGAMIGGYYTRQVTNAIKKNGNDPTKWETNPMSGTQWCNYPFLMEGVKDNTQKYIRVTLRHNAPKPKTIYFLDGKLVTDEAILADIKSWLKPTYNKVKQLENGVSLEDMVFPLNINIKNVLYLAHEKMEEGEIPQEFRTLR